MSRTVRQHPPPPDAIAESARLERRLARRAASLDEAKRQFLRMVSHELRTPLNAIIGFSEIIAAELYGPLGAPQYREYAAHVRQSGHRLLKLVNQILEIARLQDRVVDMEARPESLDHALDDVRDLIGEELDDRKARLLVENDGALPAVLVDPRGLRSLLRNIVENAVVYGPEGGAVTVRARERGSRVLIEIEDQGEGIDPDDIPRLMNPFEQGDTPLIRTTQGAGLGLPIARLTAEAMGGGLTLSAAPAGGLLVTVTLPAA
jgi:signal transduction histidine kinase